jgi:hypothetical protein
MDSLIELHEGDCLEKMALIPDKSIDMVLVDLPYGTTDLPWDSVIPLPPLWEQYKRIVKPNSAMLFFAAQPFTSVLVMSQLPLFSYALVWEKSCPVGYLDAAKRPMRAHEDILLFSDGRPVYNPIMTPTNRAKRTRTSQNAAAHYRDHTRIDSDNKGLAYPRSVIFTRKENGTVHPTQKPLQMLEYLIRTYSNPGATVLDNTMGSGSTMVACVRTGRNGVGIERDPKYFEVARQRIAEAQLGALQLGLGIDTVPIDVEAHIAAVDEKDKKLEELASSQLGLEL